MTDQQWETILREAIPAEDRGKVASVTVEHRDDWTGQPSLYVTAHLRNLPEDHDFIWAMERAIQKRVWSEDEELWPYVRWIGPVHEPAGVPA